MQRPPWRSQIAQSKTCRRGSPDGLNTVAGMALLSTMKRSSGAAQVSAGPAQRSLRCRRIADRRRDTATVLATAKRPPELRRCARRNGGTPIPRDRGAVASPRTPARPPHHAWPQTRPRSRGIGPAPRHRTLGTSADRPGDPGAIVSPPRPRRPCIPVPSFALVRRNLSLDHPRCREMLDQLIQDRDGTFELHLGQVVGRGCDHVYRPASLSSSPRFAVMSDVIRVCVHLVTKDFQFFVQSKIVRAQIHTADVELFPPIPAIERAAIGHDQRGGESCLLHEAGPTTAGSMLMPTFLQQVLGDFTCQPKILQGKAFPIFLANCFVFVLQ